MSISFLDLKGKSALVTGAASGIGRATADALAQVGCRVFEIDLVYNKEAEKSKSNLLRAGCDVASSKQVKDAISECESRIGSLDVLVNSAGVEFRETVLDSREEDYDRVMATNVKGVFLVCKYSIPLILKSSKSGSIINISSDLGLQPIPSTDIYAASKGAIIALTKGMSKNWAKQGLRVNCILPGPIDTPLLHRFHSEQILDFVKENLIPMGRLGRPEEVAQLVLFLASEASSFINGAAITVNGGLLG